MALFEELAVWAVPAGATGAEQMALDETMLRLATTPTLRVYRWARAEVTFGYPQRWAEARAFAGTRPLTRRCTGGGFVEHGDDLTVALVIPAAHPLAQRAPAQLYHALHCAVAAGPGLRLATIDDAQTGAACFTAPAVADVLDAGGRKVLGGALRRSREGVLYQGSWRGGATVDFPAALAGRCVDVELIGWEPLARALTDERYATSEWNQRR